MKWLKSDRWQMSWALVGQIGTLVAILGGLLSLHSMLSRPEAILVFHAESNELLWPEEIKYNDPGVLLLSEAFEEKFDKLQHEYSYARRELEALRFALSRFLSGKYEEAARLTSLEGYWTISISNTGDLTAEDVVLSVPNAALVEIQRGGKIERFEGETIPLGRVRPSEHVSALAWTTMSKYTWNTRDILVTHASGVVRPTQKQADKEESAWGALFTIAAPLLCVVAFFRLRPRFFVRKMLRQKRRRIAGEATSPEKPA